MVVISLPSLSMSDPILVLSCLVLLLLLSSNHFCPNDTNLEADNCLCHGMIGSVGNRQFIIEDGA